jgi:hypothetical protein
MEMVEAWLGGKKPVQVPAMKKGKGKQGKEYDVPDGIIAHLTRECGGNVHDHNVVEITSGSFEATPDKANGDPRRVADLDDDSNYWSDCRKRKEDIQHTRNNWVCYDFKEMRIVPTHYAIRSNWYGPGWHHLKSWLIETSGDWESWREVARQEDNKQLNGCRFAATFPVAGGEECRFIRLVNIGQNHGGSDSLTISSWEIFGSLLE